MESSTATNSSFPAKLLLVIEDFAVQAGMVAVETYIDVGSILWIFYDCLSVPSRSALLNFLELVIPKHLHTGSDITNSNNSLH